MSNIVELTLLAKNPDNQEEGTTPIYVEMDNIITAYRFPWQDMTHVILSNGGQIQVTEQPNEIMCHKEE